MQYAVLDWDNTIRRGFTLFDWMEFLYSERVLDRKINHEIEEIQIQYAEKRINHDTYARLACSTYSRAMAGVSEDLRDRLVSKYIDKDETHLQPFANGLFTYFKEHNIKPIIISGAPEYILDRYKDRFSLYKIYAFCEGYYEGYCNGRVNHNYGADKIRTVKLLCAQYGSRPLIGFGDSTSDIPLFQKAGYAFCVLGKDGFERPEYGSKIIYVRDTINNNQIMSLLERTIQYRMMPVRKKKKIKKDKLYHRVNAKNIRHRITME